MIKEKKILDTVQPSMVPSLAMRHTYEIEVEGRKVRCRTAEAAARLLAVRAARPDRCDHRARVCNQLFVLVH